MSRGRKRGREREIISADCALSTELVEGHPVTSRPRPSGKPRI